MQHGLLVYSPILLAVVYVLWRQGVPHSRRPLAGLGLAIIAGHLALHAASGARWGIDGPRFQHDLIPILAWFGAVALRRSRELDGKPEPGTSRERLGAPSQFLRARGSLGARFDRRRLHRSAEDGPVPLGARSVLPGMGSAPPAAVPRTARARRRRPSEADSEAATAAAGGARLSARIRDLPHGVRSATVRRHECSLAPPRCPLRRPRHRRNSPGHGRRNSRSSTSSFFSPRHPRRPADRRAQRAGERDAVVIVEGETDRRGRRRGAPDARPRDARPRRRDADAGTRRRALAPAHHGRRLPDRPSQALLGLQGVAWPQGGAGQPARRLDDAAHRRRRRRRLRRDRSAQGDRRRPLPRAADHRRRALSLDDRRRRRHQLPRPRGPRRRRRPHRRRRRRGAQGRARGDQVRQRLGEAPGDRGVHVGRRPPARTSTSPPKSCGSRSTRRSATVSR